MMCSEGTRVRHAGRVGEILRAAAHIDTSAAGAERVSAEAVGEAATKSAAVSLPPPGLAPPPGCPSHGSALHALGKCKACSWFWRPAGCHNGEACQHCHLCPQGEVRARRLRMQQRRQHQQQQLLELQHQQHGPRPQASRQQQKQVLKLESSSASVLDFDDASTMDGSEPEEILSTNSEESAGPASYLGLLRGLFLSTACGEPAAVEVRPPGVFFFCSRPAQPPGVFW